jgi:tetratricopeptide (TPR) repeat protein
MQTLFIRLEQVADDNLMRLGTPEALVFDDDPLEPMLAGGSPAAPTPASVIELWRSGTNRSAPCARALVAVLAKHPDTIAEIGDLESVEQFLRQALESGAARADLPYGACLAALGRVLELRDKAADAEAVYRQALNLLGTATGKEAETAWTTGSRLANLLEGSGRKVEAAQLRNRLQAQRLVDKEDDWSLGSLRSIALGMVLAGQYAEAEAIYLRLVEKRFEVGSAHCHLARLYLMTGREEAAWRELDRAWEVRGQASAYVLARIQFLKTLRRMLAGGDWKPCLLEVKRALAVPGTHADWTMRPVLEHLKPRLSQELFDLMTAVAEALGSRDRLAALETNPLWQHLGSREPSGPPAAGADPPHSEL